jgi:hypothetical protein
MFFSKRDAMVCCAVVLIATFLTPFISHAQVRRPGYVVMHSGDTTWGFIVYNEGSQATKICNFKATSDAATIRYNPGDIAGYGFKNDQFFLSRYVTPKDESTQMVFLEVVVRGRTSLYRHKNALFVEKGDTLLHPLINEDKVFFSNGISYLKPGNQFVGTLSQLMFDCADVRTQIQKTRFSQEPITKIVEKYNRCHGEKSVVYKENKPWVEATFSVMGSATISKLNYKNVPLRAGYVNGDFETLILPAVGVGLDVRSARLDERFSLDVEMQLGSGQYERHVVVERRYLTERHDFKGKITQVKVPVGIKFTWPTKKVAPYIGGGISFTRHLSSTWEGKYEISPNDTKGDIEQPLEIRDSQLGFWGGLGARIKLPRGKHTALELRYEKTNGLTGSSSDYTSLKSSITNLQMAVFLQF